MSQTNRRIDEHGVITGDDDAPSNTFKFFARHSGAFKVRTDKDTGQRILDITLSVPADPEEFELAVRPILRILGECPVNTDMTIIVQPIARQRRLL